MNPESKMWPSAERLPRSKRRTTFPLGETDWGRAKKHRALTRQETELAASALAGAARDRKRRHARLEDFVRTGTNPMDGAL